MTGRTAIQFTYSVLITLTNNLARCHPREVFFILNYSTPNRPYTNLFLGPFLFLALYSGYTNI